MWNEIEFWDLVNKYNQIKNVYSSVYGEFSRFIDVETNELDYESCYFDRTYLDLDPGEYPGGDPNDLDKKGNPRNWPLLYYTVYAFEEWLWSKQIMHVCLFSGGGFNFYIFVKDNIKHKKDCLKQFHKWLDKKFHLHLDPSIIGDVAQIGRVYGTFNRNKKRWCISLTHDEVMGGLDNIFALSLTQRKVWHLIGNNRLNISRFDVPEKVQKTFVFLSENEGRMTSDGRDVFEELERHGIYSEEIPPCIQKMLRTPRLRYQERYRLIQWLMDNQLSEWESMLVLKKCLSPDRFAHCVTFKGADRATRRKAGRCERQLQYIYKKRGRKKEYYLSCGGMAEIGWCVGKDECETRGNIFPD